MGIIRVLPQIVINKIAAGEVIERPASVVKELLENSLDAGATRIEVEVEEGGRKLIRVIDNGQGMDGEDVGLAFESHATSKLRDSADLSFITTMGFRGEALPSIAAVAQVHLMSRLRGSASGHEMTAVGGQRSEVKACGAAEGTAVAVRNLFFNLPARRSFLKSVPTESSHIVDLITQMALARPDVHFVVRRHQTEIINTAASADRRDRLADLFTAELADQLIAVEGGRGPVRVTGYAAPPHEAHANARLQMIFVNRRPVRDRGLTRALMDAYAGLLAPGRFPPAFLFLQMDPREVDVNVSPTKIQVRFRNPQDVFLAVREAVRQALCSHDIQPRVPVPGTESVPLERPAAAAAAWPRTPSCAPPSASRPLPLSWAPGEPAERAAVPLAPPAAAHPPARHFTQVHNSFIVLERSDGLEIIDQHALHERILYDQIQQRLTQAPLETQRLLVPEVIELSRRELELLEPAMAVARQLGIEIEAFGARSVAVHALPRLLSNEPPMGLVRDLLDHLAESGEAPTPEALRKHLAEMIACKAAVKAGEPLSDDEIASLLQKRQDCGRPETCPHGRPTSLRLSRDELDKYFKRT